MPASEDEADHVSGDQHGDLIVDVTVKDLKGQDENHVEGHFGIARNKNRVDHCRLQGLFPRLSAGKGEKHSGESRDQKDKPHQFDLAKREEDRFQARGVLGTPMDDIVKIAGRTEIAVDPCPLGRL